MSGVTLLVQLCGLVEKICAGTGSSVRAAIAALTSIPKFDADVQIIDGIAFDDRLLSQLSWVGW